MGKDDIFPIRYISFKKFKELFELKSPTLISDYKGSFGSPLEETYIHADIVRMDGHSNIIYFWDWLRYKKFLSIEWNLQMAAREEELNSTQRSPIQAEDIRRLLNQEERRRFLDVKIVIPECKRLNQICVESDNLLKDIDQIYGEFKRIISDI